MRRLCTGLGGGEWWAARENSPWVFFFWLSFWMAFPEPRARGGEPCLGRQQGCGCLGPPWLHPCPNLPPGFIGGGGGPVTVPLKPRWVHGEAPVVPPQPSQGMRPFFLSQRHLLILPGGFSRPPPSPGSRVGCHQPCSATASCPRCHPAADSHPGHQPVGSGYPGTGLPHPRLPAAPHSEVSFATISFLCSLEPNLCLTPCPHAALGTPPRLGDPPQHPQPSRLPPKVMLSRAEAGSPFPTFVPGGMQPPRGFSISPSPVSTGQQTPGKALLLLTSRPPRDYQVLNSRELALLPVRNLCASVPPSRCTGPLWSPGDERGAGGRAWGRGTWCSVPLSGD